MSISLCWISRFFVLLQKRVLCTLSGECKEHKFKLEQENVFTENTFFVFLVRILVKKDVLIVIFSSSCLFIHLKYEYFPHLERQCTTRYSASCRGGFDGRLKGASRTLKVASLSVIGKN